MQTYISRINPYKMLLLNDGDLFIENPEILEEILENGTIVYVSRASLEGLDASFQAVALDRRIAKELLNKKLNKKISAPERANFLENNCFLLTNNC